MTIPAPDKHEVLISYMRGVINRTDTLIEYFTAKPGTALVFRKESEDFIEDAREFKAWLEFYIDRYNEAKKEVIDQCPDCGRDFISRTRQTGIIPTVCGKCFSNEKI